MGCTKTLDLSIAQTGDTGMDQAIFETTTGKIFGVRGQWLFKFNATTGVLEDSVRFRSNVSGTSTIAAIGGNLYIGSSWQPTVDYTVVAPYVDEDIYIVSAAAFTVTGRFNFGNKLNQARETVTYGWRYLVAAGSLLLGYYSDNAGLSLFSVDPSNLPGFTKVATQGFTDIAWDSSNSVMWATSSYFPNIYCYDTTFGSSCFDTNGNLNSICGICYNSAQNKVYAVDGTFAFYSFSAALAVPAFTNFHVSNFNSGRINSTAFRIKSVNGLASNPLNGKVLMPTWADDCVLVIDPATDTVSSVKTGFTAPIDVVSTTTKNWAVQTGVTGLKEIT